MAYCGKECQKRDWKAFHKPECTAIRKGQGTSQSLGLQSDRLTCCEMPGVVRAKTYPDMTRSGVFADCGVVLAAHLGGHWTGNPAKYSLFPFGMTAEPARRASAPKAGGAR